MLVDPKMLHAGGNDSHRAGEHAQDGVNALSRGPLSSGMFGEFAAAEAFSAAVSSAHAEHVTNLQAHQQALTTVGVKAHRAATGFTDVDDRNAAEMRSVRRSSAGSSSRF